MHLIVQLGTASFLILAGYNLFDFTRIFTKHIATTPAPPTGGGTTAKGPMPPPLLHKLLMLLLLLLRLLVSHY